MPELPEVETIRLGLQPHLKGRSFAAFETGDLKVFQFEPLELAKLEGQTVSELRRRGKFLLLVLERDVLVIHLGMTGQLTLRDLSENDSDRFLRQEATGLQRIRQHAPDKHTHFQIHLDDGRTLMFRDIRKFGKIHLLNNDGRAVQEFFSHMGMEPLDCSYRFETFVTYLGKRRQRIKSFLLDQRFIAGVGNIYADEALFESSIHPGTRIRYLRRFQKEALFKVIPRVLEKGIEFGGTSLRDYVNSDGQSGTHQQELRVYGREGQPCYRCATPIQRIVISQRSSHFCPVCQKR